MFFVRARAAPWHYGAAMINLLIANGRKVLFLPTYSPDYNPIEKTYNVIKQWLRRWFVELQQVGMSDADIIDMAFQDVSVDVINNIIAANAFDPAYGL